MAHRRASTAFEEYRTRLSPSLQRHAARAQARYAELDQRLSDGTVDVKAARERARLEQVNALIVQRAAVLKSLGQLDATVRAAAPADAANPDFVALAREEHESLCREAAAVEASIAAALVPRDASDGKGAILEIRLGTGGQESSLFAAEMLAMYQKYAAARRWRFEVIHESVSPVGGLREAAVSVSGAGVFGALKFESGVHRVQRVPQTEAAGRVHTSTVTVAVLPEAEALDVVLRDADIKIDTFRSSGAGGQHVNTTDSAVRLTHIPTGTVVAIQDERSQHKNKAKAMKILRARIFDAERQRQSAAQAELRSAQIGSGDRSERIRTYNFPQGRVTDHRVGVTLHDLPAVLGGGLDPFIDALAAAQLEAQLQALEASPGSGAPAR